MDVTKLTIYRRIINMINSAYANELNNELDKTLVENSLMKILISITSELADCIDIDSFVNFEAKLCKISEFSSGIIFKHDINNSNNVSINKSLVYFIATYLYSLSKYGKSLMTYNQDNIKLLYDELFGDYVGFRKEPSLQNYDKFCNYGIILKQLFSKRILGLYLDVLSRLENVNNPKKYIMGSGSTCSTYIRTFYIDYLFDYKKRKRMTENSSVDTEVDVSTTPSNKKHASRESVSQKSESEFLDSFKIDMSLFD